MRIASRSIKSGLAIALIASVLLSACSSTPADNPEYRSEVLELNDPFEQTNRAVFEFNRKIDRALFKPAAQVYRGIIPGFGREMLRNVLNNMRSPLILMNDILQGETTRAGETGSRILANTIVGLGGFFDVTDIDFHSEDFGQTLAVWGIKEGPYLVLPFLGPSPVRDTIGLIGDSLMDPVSSYTRSSGGLTLSWIRTGMRAIDSRSRNIETLDEIERGAIDFYATIRSLYRQRRDDEIANGHPSETIPIPEISWEDGGEIEEKQALIVTE